MEKSIGLKRVNILLRQTWRPEIGDKFSSRHGQKGYVIQGTHRLENDGLS